MSSTSLKPLAELLSLGATMPTLALSLAVVVKWGPAALVALRSPKKTADQWFVLGVVIGFIGECLDNGYWSLPWTASYINHPWKDTLFDSGVYFNLVFRQGLGTCAAFCHLKASEMTESHHTRFTLSLLGASILTGLLCSALLAANYGGS